MKFYLIDAFTTVKFTGNPAVVVFLDGEKFLEDPELQQIAKEFNQPATAFVLPKDTTSDPSNPEYYLRYFTPGSEIVLCGHATLSSSFVIFKTTELPSDATIHFYTKSAGVLKAARDWTGKVLLNFPASIPTSDASLSEFLVKSIYASGLPLKIEDVKYAGRTAYDVIVEISENVNLKSISVDYDGLNQASLGVRGLIITSAPSKLLVSASKCDFISRFFAIIGRHEDPVTGSAHCALSPYWSLKTGRFEQMVGYQVSERTGVVEARWLKDEGRVELSGNAVLMGSGEIFT